MTTARLFLTAFITNRVGIKCYILSVHTHTRSLLDGFRSYLINGDDILALLTLCNKQVWPKQIIVHFSKSLCFFVVFCFLNYHGNYTSFIYLFPFHLMKH